ncbi:MAG: thioredoxin family protein [Myxococcales bacterium]|jgi:thiol-disulfide isomerase/thioredoxin|nr:MAG: thioredoxin family protein [Myxococcales bacterium]
MAASSTMLSLGSKLPVFRLSDTDGGVVCSDDLTDAPAIVVLFICNHCPYVKHISAELALLAEEYVEQGVAIVAINSNDAEAYPDDAPDKMAEEKRSAGYAFPYLFDETQEVARAFRAACTPDIYLFDGSAELVYRGQFDGSRPGNDIPVTGYDLRAALDAVLHGRPALEDQIPSIGCNIKWKSGNEPDYYSV